MYKVKKQKDGWSVCNPDGDEIALFELEQNAKKYAKSKEEESEVIINNNV